MVIGDLTPSGKNSCMLILSFLLETQEIFIEDYPEDKVCSQHSRELRSNCLLPIWLFQLSVVPISASSALFLLLPPTDLGTTPSCLKVMTYECISRYASMLLNPQPAPYIPEISLSMEIDDAPTPCAILCTGQKRQLVRFSSFHCIVKCCCRIGIIGV